MFNVFLSYVARNHTCTREPSPGELFYSDVTEFANVEAVVCYDRVARSPARMEFFKNIFIIGERNDQAKPRIDHIQESFATATRVVDCMKIVDYQHGFI